jgi:RimJ/RimL family protein N-acetyltransferase
MRTTNVADVADLRERSDYAPGGVPGFPERFTTERLQLRCWDPEDAPALRAAIDGSLLQLREFLPWAMTEPSPIEELASRLRDFRERFRAHQEWMFALLDLRTGALLGGAGLHRRAAADALEIGYWLTVEARGRGLATEAVLALTRLALGPGGVSRVEIRCHPRNLPSIAVARRAGFQYLAMLPEDTTTPSGAPRDTLVWERRYFPEPATPATGGG